MCYFINPDVLLHTLLSRMCYSKIQDVLFLDKGYAIPRYRMCFSKIQDVLFQDKIQDVLFLDTGCAFPRYRMYYSMVLDVLLQENRLVVFFKLNKVVLLGMPKIIFSPESHRAGPFWLVRSWSVLKQ